ncbi:TPA: hypothetical protein RQK83_000415 [Vibrio vulnificus]|uniref:hypothetical protein n=1 Tax=Vibrio anguillarum TaxID=55601 RepID=UPI001C9C3890|nr:hypothetical protein [Vibrio anguillarum]MBY7666952.1 hypothetical protein [Vibrio anguillarum]HDY8049440.1 hypothetical protein [Vibrio vulnificus]
MKISEIGSLEDIQEYEKKSNLRDDIQALITPLKIEASCDEELLNIIDFLKCKWLDFQKGPFVSEQQEYIFYLTKLEGKQRNNALGITDEHYEDKKLAKKWKNSIAQKVASDKGGCDQAMTTLLKIYDALVDDFEDDNE